MVNEYVDVTYFRNLGVPTPPTDTLIQTTINVSQALLERQCRQWFYARTLDFYFDGNGTSLLQIGVPIISVSALYVNGSATALDSAFYKVYSERAYPDHRRNPKVSLTRELESSSIFTSRQDGRSQFAPGRQNCRIVGSFGYTEPDGSVPAPIIEAMSRMVVERLSLPSYGVAPITPPTLPTGIVQSERTDGHAITYATTGISAGPTFKPGFQGISRDPFVLEIVRLYRAPIGIATPTDWV